MKSSILALLVSLVACVYAAAISLEQDMQGLEKRVEDGDIISTTLEDGRNKIEIFENGVLEVSIIETADGGAQFFDADGNEIDADELDDDEDDEQHALVKRSKTRILKAIAKMVKKYGYKIWVYINCAGRKVVFECGSYFASCAERGILEPWECIGGTACVGASHKQCKKLVIQD
ncbi:hypothetical protein VUR80DRAFT_8606 [Thermomyces stellatus]